jgi:hypothetical protein
MATGRIGIEEGTKFVFSEGIASATPDCASRRDARRGGCRMEKDAHEIA